MTNSPITAAKYHYLHNTLVKEPPLAAMFGYENKDAATTLGSVLLAGLSICETVYAHINAHPPYKETFEPKSSYAGALNWPAPEYCQWPAR